MTMGSCVFGVEAEESRMGTFKLATITCCLISIVMVAVGLFMLRRWHKAQLKKKEYEDELRKREDEEINAPLGSAVDAAAADAGADAAFEDGLESFRSPRGEENRDMEFDNTEKFDPNQLPEITTPFEWCTALIVTLSNTSKHAVSAARVCVMCMHVHHVCRLGCRYALQIRRMYVPTCLYCSDETLFLCLSLSLCLSLPL